MADNYSRLREIADQAERAPELTLDELRAANPTQPNRTKSEMLTLRVPADTMASLEKLASQRGLPVSALVRGLITRGLAAETNSVSDTVQRLAAEVDRLKSLIG